MKPILAALLLTLLTACTTMKVEQFAASPPEFRPERYFAGKTEAWGFFQDRFNNVRRQFKVDIDGTVEGDTLTMDERFVYDDGERQSRVWKIRKTGADTYDGTAGDVIGVAHGRVAGRALHWEYDLDLKTGDRSLVTHFDDWLLQQDDRVMLNTSTLTKYGVEIGRVYVFFRKAG